MSHCGVLVSGAVESWMLHRGLREGELNLSKRSFGNETIRLKRWEDNIKERSSGRCFG